MPDKIPLTPEIIQSDELFDKWLWGELYEAVKPFLSEIDAAMNEYVSEVLNGTGDGEPVGVIHAGQNTAGQTARAD